MKILTLAFLSCQVVVGSNTFVYSFSGDFQDAKIHPMLFLIRAIRNHPHKKRFVIYFQTKAPMSTLKTKINFDVDKQKMYIRYEDTYGFKSLKMLRKVTLEKIIKCYHSTRLMQSGEDNFDSLEDYRCLSKTLFLDKGPINGADQ